MQKVTVIVLHYGNNKDTLECLSSLDKVLLSSETGLEIVVVDNGSKEKFTLDLFKNSFSKKRHAELVSESRKTLKQSMKQVQDRVQGDTFSTNIKIITNEKNLGFAEGNNVGIRRALKNGAYYVLILNNDTIVDKNLIKELLSVGKQGDSIGIVVPKIYFAPGFEFHKDRYAKKDLGKVIWYAGGDMDWGNVIGCHRGVDEVDRGQYNGTEKTLFASGCCMFIKKEVFEKVGLFDDKYFLYYEDADLSERIKRVGYKIVYGPKAILWHKNAGSAGGSGSKLQDYYITRNRLLFGFRYAPIRSKIALFRESLSVLLRGRYWQKRGVLDFYLGKFGKGSYSI